MVRPLRFLVAPDKFKGSMDAAAAARAICEGIGNVLPDAVFQVVPLADGGEGTAEAFVSIGRGVRRPTNVEDALRRPIDSSFVELADGRGAVIEMAAAAGLVHLRPEERNPLWATTFGVGQLMSLALQRGAKELWIGLGGSATNDGGAGLAAALGWSFHDQNGEPFFPFPAELHRLAALTPPTSSPSFRCVALADVSNPLLGPNGATAIFGPQKGVTRETAGILENSLTRLADVASETLGRDHRATSGAGAAGGTGFGLLTFCNAEIRSGFEVIAELSQISEAVEWADWIITGEGSLDRQSISGKGPVGLARMGRAAGKMTAAFAGRVETDEALSAEFDAIHVITPPGLPLRQALSDGPSLLRAAAEEFAKSLTS
ncbi:MAG: glycerate kinase [Terrimicrobiaceae bacterium]|nr:glycerate kinase [Terrimicrobiaceae bacterium]